MEINKVNNTPHFGARVVVNKTGFKNIKKDIIDSFEISTRTTGISTAAPSEISIIPSEIVEAKEYNNETKILKFLKAQIEKIDNILNKILKRNIKTISLEDTEGIKYTANLKTQSSAGASTISTGAGSYTAALGSGLDQSAHYPVTIFQPSIPESTALHSPNSIADLFGGLEHSAYKNLYREHGLGNESASLMSTMWSSGGAFAQGLGHGAIKDAENIAKGIRKIPS